VHLHPDFILFVFSQTEEERIATDSNRGPSLPAFGRNVPSMRMKFEGRCTCRGRMRKERRIRGEACSNYTDSLLTRFLEAPERNVSE